MNTESTPTPENIDPLTIIEARIARNKAQRKEKEEAERLADQERDTANAARLPEIVDQLVLELGDLHALFLEADPGFEQAYSMEVIDRDTLIPEPDTAPDPVKPVKRSWLDRLLWIKPPVGAPVYRTKRTSGLDLPHKTIPYWTAALTHVGDRPILIYIEVETGTLYWDYKTTYYADLLDPAVLKQELSFSEVSALLKNVQSTARSLRNTIRWAKEDAERAARITASQNEQTGTAG